MSSFFSHPTNPHPHLQSHRRTQPQPDSKTPAWTPPRTSPRDRVVAVARFLTTSVGAIVLAGCATALPTVVHVPSRTLTADAASPLAIAAHEAALPPGLSGFDPMPQGAIALDARLALIERATTSVDLQTYLLADDQTGRLILRSLADAAARGVRVRLLLDDFYVVGMDRLLLGFAAHPNVEVRLFNPFVSGRGGSLPRLVAFATSFKRLNHRMHNKLVTADGAMAIAGGRNTADEYFFRSAESNFIDFDLLITGELVGHLGETFDEYWNSEQVFPLASIADNDDPPAARRAFFDQAVAAANAPRPPTPEHDLFDQPPVSIGLAQHRLPFVAAAATAHADSPLKASLTESHGEAANDTVRRRAFALFPQIKFELVMFSPYFIPGDSGLEAFRRLRARGVEIRVVTNSLPTSDEPLVNIGYEHYRQPLLEMGTHLYELSSKRLTRVPALQHVLGKSQGRLHTKMGFIDRETVLVGSMNLDPRSATINTELGISVKSAALAKQMLGVYEIDNLEAAYELTLAPDGKTVRWAHAVEDGEPVADDDHEVNLWQRVQLFFQYLFVSDDLL